MISWLLYCLHQCLGLFHSVNIKKHFELPLNILCHCTLRNSVHCKATSEHRIVFLHLKVLPELPALNILAIKHFLLRPQEKVVHVSTVVHSYKCTVVHDVTLRHNLAPCLYDLNVWRLICICFRRSTSTLHMGRSTASWQGRHGQTDLSSWLIMILDWTVSLTSLPTDSVYILHIYLICIRIYTCVKEIANVTETEHKFWS